MNVHFGSDIQVMYSGSNGTAQADGLENKHRPCRLVVSNSIRSCGAFVSTKLIARSLIITTRYVKRGGHNKVHGDARKLEGLYFR